MQPARANDRATRTVAVVGSPNTGKSTLFNRLTGARQRVGNYPGITVEKHVGRVRLPNGDADLVDLPGAYTLTPASDDERVVITALTGHIDRTPPPDAAICVVDATNVRRNLFLASQVAETGVPLVIALNMVDAAADAGITIDAARLGRSLGVPVVPTVAATGQGVDQLRAAIEPVLAERPAFTPVPWPDAINVARQQLRAAAPVEIRETLTEAELHRVLFDVDSDLPAHIGWPHPEAAIEAAREGLIAAGIDPISVEAHLRYEHIDTLLAGCVHRGPATRPSPSNAIDRYLTHRVFGLGIFAVLMFLVFASIYWLAQPLMDGVDGLFAWLGVKASSALAATPMLQSLVTDGVIAGVGGVVIFLPQILTLFLFIAVLEDSGYMARAAFLMDKVFSWCGLNGKSFVPMLSSFACAVPAIMSTRTIEDPKARLTTILVSPLMSCSARLPVYVLMIGAFIQPTYGPLWAATALFGMHLLGLFVAIPVALIISRRLRVKPLPFVLEMPPYRAPRARDIALRLYRNGREFVVNAGTVILAFSIIIWALTYFPRPAAVRAGVAEVVAAREGIPLVAASARLEGDLAGDLNLAYLEQSYLGRTGKALQPLFAPAGFDWKITVGVLASFPAREIIVSTLGIIYNVGAADLEAGGESGALRTRLAAATWPDGRKVYSPVVAVAIMVFFAFCMQCGSTVAVIARESGWRWAGFTFVYMTTLAWVSAVLVYQIGTLLAGGVAA